MHVKYRQCCRVCGSKDLVKVLDLGHQYLQGAFYKPGTPLPPMRTLPTELVRCDVTTNEKGCGLVQLRHSLPPTILYANYWYRSGTNATMRSHLKGIAESATAIQNRLAGAKPLTVLDIGCNDGTLLNCYPDGTEKWGVDPSDIAASLASDIKLVNTVFPSPAAQKAIAPGSIDIVTSIAMYYDLEDPVGFAREIARLLSDRGIWILEMSYLPLMLKQNSFDTICHEHLEYYSLAVLERIMSEAGMRIFKAELNAINGGSIRCYVCPQALSDLDTPEDKAVLHALRVREFEFELDTDAPYEAFCHRIESLRSQTRNLIKSIHDRGQKVHIYGASTKGNVLLQWYGLDHKWIECAADRNPDKDGARTLGTDIPIVSEETSRKAKPDYYLVLPWHFQKEFLERERATVMAGTKMIFPLPNLVIVDANNIDHEINQSAARDATWLNIIEDDGARDQILMKS